MAACAGSGSSASTSTSCTASIPPCPSPTNLARFGACRKRGKSSTSACRKCRLPRSRGRGRSSRSSRCRTVTARAIASTTVCSTTASARRSPFCRGTRWVPGRCCVGGARWPRWRRACTRRPPRSRSRGSYGAPPRCCPSREPRACSTWKRTSARRCSSWRRATSKKSRARPEPASIRSLLLPGRAHVLRHQADERVHERSVCLLGILGGEVELTAHQGDMTDSLGRPGARAPQGGPGERRQQPHGELHLHGSLEMRGHEPRQAAGPPGICDLEMSGEYGGDVALLAQLLSRGDPQLLLTHALH